MSGVIFEEIECKSIINRVQAPGMGFRWTINPYRGCQHACVYCFARGTHQYLGYDSGRDFERRIIVKINAPKVLREELRRPSWQRELIVLGTACDPWQQAEAKYQITRQMLKALLQYAQPVHTLTKSPMILRDIDLWSELAKVVSVRVAFSIPTLDEEVWKKTEPGTAKPIKRLQAIEKLAQAGVPAGLMLAPIIPGVTDDEAHMETVIRAAREHGASFLAPNVLHLKPGTKEWFLPFLRETYPHLLPQYARFYRGAYAPQHYTSEVLAKVAELKQKWPMQAIRVEAPMPLGQLQLGL